MEEERLRGEVERMLTDERYYSFNHQHFSYLARGQYADQLRTWLQFFPRDQMLLLKSEDLLREPRVSLDRITGFLGLRQWHPPEFRPVRVGRYPPMDPATRQHLTALFAAPNRTLTELAGTEFTW